MQWAKAQDIPVGPGRGSATSSITAYALGITEIDPLEYNLHFERFINPELPSAPDFDIDVSWTGRDKVIDYIIKKYGQNRVGHITMFSSQDKNRVINLHAAGLVISKTDLAACAPLYHDPETEELYRNPETGLAAVQCSFDELEKYGLVKFDILGLQTLDDISAAEERIRNRGGPYADFSVSKIPLDDQKTFAMLNGGDTQGIFGFKNNAMPFNITLQQFKPACFTDLVLLYAINRPGIPDFLREDIRAFPSCLENIFTETYGIIVYQEQIMLIIRRSTGYSLAQADVLRRNMMKNNNTNIGIERERFITAADKQGFNNQEAEFFFNFLVSVSRYAYNKSHAVACTLLAYQTAYLKANFPEDFAQTFSSGD